MNHADPTGKETHYYRPDGTVVVVQTYQVDTTEGPVASNEVIERAVTSSLSGTSSAGQKVTVIAVNSPRHNPIIFEGDSTLSSKNKVGVLRSHINKIDGRHVRLSPDATPETIGHEFGHGVGAEERNHDVFDAFGAVLGTVANDHHENTIMGDKGGPANAIQIDDILRHADKKVHCAGGPLGGCDPK